MILQRVFLLVGLAVIAVAASHPVSAQTLPAETMKVPDSQAEISLGFVPVVRQTAPAVVSIYTKKLVERRASPFAGDPFFERLFGGMFPGDQTHQQKQCLPGMPPVMAEQCLLDPVKAIGQHLLFH